MFTVLRDEQTLRLRDRKRKDVDDVNVTGGRSVKRDGALNVRTARCVRLGTFGT